MKNSVLISLLVIFCISLFSIDNIDPEYYRVKSGDRFLIQVVSIDTLNKVVPVLPEGNISFMPFIKSQKVAGQTLNNAKKVIYEKISNQVKNSEINVQLADIAPFSFNVTGAVKKPGNYNSEEMISLDQAIMLSGGLLPSASKKIKIRRDQKVVNADLQDFLLNGDLEDNPYILHDDKIQVNFAENFIKVYVNNDTLNTVEYVEIEDEMKLSDVLFGLGYKSMNADYFKIGILRDDEVISADKNNKVKAGDEIYLANNSKSIYVMGSVLKPGRFPYNANSNIYYYIGLAGGYRKTASKNKAFIIDQNGNKIVVGERKLKPGDTIYIPENFFSKLSIYLSPITAFASLITTVILIQDKISN